MDQPASLYCAICDRDHTTTPSLVLARWQDQDICTDCLEHRPGKEEAEAQAMPSPVPMTQEAYRATGGGRCPVCCNYCLEYDDCEVEDGFVHQRGVCPPCGTVWTTYYRLAGYVREDGIRGNDDDWNAFLNTTILETTHH